MRGTKAGGNKLLLQLTYLPDEMIIASRHTEIVRRLDRSRALRLAGPCQRIVVDGQVRQGFATPMPQSDPHRPGLPTATGALARLAAQEARAAGLDLGPLLKSAGLTAAQIEDANERLSVKAQIAFESMQTRGGWLPVELGFGLT